MRIEDKSDTGHPLPPRRRTFWCWLFHGWCTLGTRCQKCLRGSPWFDHEGKITFPQVLGLLFIAAGFVILVSLVLAVFLRWH